MKHGICGQKDHVENSGIEEATLSAKKINQVEKLQQKNSKW